jgi:hypothetical protein
MSGYGGELPIADESPASDYGTSLPLAARAEEKVQQPQQKAGRRPLPPGPNVVPSAEPSMRSGRALTSSTHAQFEAMRRALAESTPLVRMAKNDKTSEQSTQVDSLDLGRAPMKGGSRASIRHHQFMSLTQDQMQKANDLAASLRVRDLSGQTVPAVVASDPSFEHLNLEEKMSLLRGRVGAERAADVMQRILLSSGVLSTEAINEAVTKELYGLSETREG